MWQMKLKVKHNDCPVVTRLEKFHFNVLSYPSTWYKHGREKRVTHICFMQGSPEAKTAFLKDFEKDKDLVRLEVEGDVFTYEYRLRRGGQHVQLYYNAKMVFVEPVLNSPDGHEYWHVASWDREVLSKFYRDLLDNMDYVEILSLKESKLKNVYFPNIMPSLSKEQEKAATLAYEHGYYHYPRRIALRQLAKIAGVSLSTFQENLRRAEIVLLPHLIEQRIKHSQNNALELVIKTRLKKQLRRKAAS